jgi:periplasmic divalent cation tolerance protein
MGDSQYQIVFMTAANEEEADRIAERLVSDGLAACVSIVPSCRSVYRWEGKIVKETEALIIAKTHRSGFSKLEITVTSMHSYDVPEIIAVDLQTASAGYLQFLQDTLGGFSPDG